MKNLYAKFVLWVIGPALDLRNTEAQYAPLNSVRILNAASLLEERV